MEIQNILYLDVRNHIITLHTEKEEYRFKGKLQEEEIKLEVYDFVRCHQGYLVNMAWIQAMEEDDIILKSGVRISISRRMRKSTIDAFSNYIAGICV